MAVPQSVRTLLPWVHTRRRSRPELDSREPGGRGVGPRGMEGRGKTCPRPSPVSDSTPTPTPAPKKVETKPRKAAGEKNKSSDKKVQPKGKRGAKGKQAGAANQETKDLPAGNGETKNEESPTSDAAGEKEAKSD